MTTGSLVLEGMHGIDYSERARPSSIPGRLPADAQMVCDDFLAEAEDRGVVASNTHANARQERDDLFRLRSELADAEARDRNGGRDDRHLAMVRRQIETAAGKLRSVNERAATQSASAAALRSLCTAIEEWRADHARVVILPHQGAAPRLGRGERPVEAVERCRATVADLKSQIGVLTRARLTTAEAKANARVFVAEAGGRARPEIDGLFREGDGAPYFRHLPATVVAPVQFGTLGGMDLGGPVRDGLALIAWLMPDAMIAALDRDIDAAGGDAKAVSAADRVTQLAKLRAQCLATERDEEAFLRMAVAQGTPIDRRPDADPRAVLQVVVANERHTN